ncbi:hypothetical protein G9A89_015477 [Geosiphon pyriformis]|nr:hypothetical protein G9A89_015477 [Geosiphon pyriformis]
MSGPSAKRRSARVLTAGSVSGGSTQKVKKPLSSVKLSSTDKNLKDGRPVSVDGQPTSMDTDGKAFDGKVTSDSQMNMPNAKRFNTGAAISSPLGSINYNMDDEKEVSLPPLDPKIVKTQVEVAVKKSFALDINLSAVEGKSATAKTQVVRKLFSRINGFGGATTPSKFEGIIRSMFTSSESMKKTTSLAKENDIVVNSDLKRQKVHSDRAVVIKEIPMNMPKEMIVTAVSEFGQVTVVEFAESSQADQLAAKWSFLIGKNSVRMAKTVQNREMWVSKDWYRVLLFTLPVETMAHDLGNLLVGAGGKTCVINCFLDTGNRICCAVICFENDKDLESAFHTEPVFGGVKLSWARLDLVRCERCRKLGHSVLECDAKVSHSPKLSKSFKKVVSNENCLQLAKLYAKKSVSISRPAVFGGKSWAQVVSLASSSNGPHFGFGPNFGSFSGASGLVGNSSFASPVSLILETRLASLKRSLELFTDKMSSIVGKLDSLSLPLVASGLVDTKFGSDMVLDEPDSVVDPLSLIFSGASRLGSSSSKILTLKVGCLESKMVALEALVSSVLEKLDQMCAGSVSIVTETKLKDKIWPWITTKFDGVWVFISGLDSGYLGSGVAIVMNNSLARHVFKVSEAGDINSLIAKVVNESSFVVLGSDFNKNGVCKSASFKKCFDLDLVNVLSGSVLVKMPTWGNSCGVVKTIDYMFVSLSLINAVVDRGVTGVEDFFNTNHKAVSVGLNGLLDSQLNSMRKQTNKDCWKFDFGNAGKKGWNNFKNAMLANGLMFSSNFAASAESSDLDAMWDIVHKVMVLSAVGTFKKKWFKGYDEVFTKSSSRFYKLELLVSKLVKASHLSFSVEFALLLNTFDRIHSALAKARKSYCFAKLLESKHAEESHIRAAINRRMESFESDKSHTIRSVLECPFRKVVLDHLVVGNELILEPSLVKARMDGIMEGWTRKHKVVPDISDIWSCQYMPLEHVFDGAFSGVISPVGFNELFSVVSGLPKGKAAGLSGISNKLWKHCDRSILDMFLVLLNSCLIRESIPSAWKEAWVSMIPKPYEWEETACKILSKIFSDKILLACSTFDVLCGDNFSVLKGMTNQFLIFAIGSVIEDALKKNRELWLAYDSVGWKHLRDSLVRIKMCRRFIRFFGSIHNGCINRVMTDFGLTDEYEVHDGLDQREVFSPLLWCIFYDPLLCEVKRQADGCGYRLNSHFISGCGCAESQAGVSSFFTADAFVDNTIWVGSSQNATQHILNVASEFFSINAISINNDKTVAIPINCDGTASSLLISGSPISIAKKGESHHYLGIYLSTESFSKPSLVKAHSDVRFFSNLVLRKAVSDKQFSYLVSAVLFPIIEYRTQFSYIPISAYGKSKFGLPCDFPNNAIHHPSLYGLKTFEQVQAESKMALVIFFVNSVGILGHLFSYQSHDLQVLCWHPLHPLQCLVRVKVNPLNNFLTGMVHIFSGCDLSLGGFLSSAFCRRDGISMSLVLGESNYVKNVSSLRHYGIAFWKTFKRWKRLDSRGPVLVWFKLSVCFLGGMSSFPVCSTLLADRGSSDVLRSHEFGIIGAGLFNSNVGRLSVYTDGSLSDLGTVDIKAGAAVFFEDISMGLGMGVSGLMSSTLIELQTIALVLECVPLSRSVDLFSDSQAALNACKLEMELVCPDFRNWCWIECCHIVNVIHPDKLARAAVLSGWHLPHSVDKHYLRGGETTISGNSRHFVWDIFWSVYHVYWEISCGMRVVADSLRTDIDWFRSSLVWHLDSHMAAGFTSKRTAGFRTYFMKTLYHWLPVAMRNVMCLFCGNVEVSNHVFFCSFNANGRAQLLDAHAAVWGVCSGLAYSSSGVSQLMSTCVSDILVSTALCKGFVFKDWFCESVSVFKDSRIAGQTIMAFVREFSLAFWEDIWLVRVKYHAFMEKNGLISCNGSVPLLSVAKTIGVSFGFRKSCLFFSGIGGKISVHIDA